MAEEPVERFRPTSGRLLGVIGLALAAAVVAAGPSTPTGTSRCR
jgi:hypothetical protein